MKNTIKIFIALIGLNALFYGPAIVRALTIEAEEAGTPYSRVELFKSGNLNGFIYHAAGGDTINLYTDTIKVSYK